MSNTYDPTDLESLEREQSTRGEKVKSAAELELADFKWLMGSKRGRRIIWRHLDRSGVFRTSFSTNSMTMAFSEGNRNDGLRTIGLIHSICPELYPVMVKEANDNRPDDSSNGPQSH